MEIRGAALETEPPAYGLKDRGFPEARAFQNRVAEWVHEGTSPVAVLQAPTGGGKTVTFHELIETHALTLLVYPTNALLRQQRDRFEDADVDVKLLNSDTLGGHGQARTQNLLAAVDQYRNDHDVVVTNPDILQAIVQDMYRGGDAIEFFNRFDAIVYDEFHFYDTLAASGILLQIKILTERRPDSKVLLASATPNDAFPEFLREDLGLALTEIRATYSQTGDQFRYPVTLTRHEDRRIMADDPTKAAVIDRLDRHLETAPDTDGPSAALVFNSAYDSNEFHRQLASSHPEVFAATKKDNGFDTNDHTPSTPLDDATILNTTSKGEIGLDNDIRLLIMENPGHPAPFLQRFGRAGRHAPADVHVYGLGQGPWGDDVDFPTFADQIYTGLQDTKTPQKQLADLIGFRAAHALASREGAPTWMNEELRVDFTENITQYGRWRRFIEYVRSERDEIGGFAPKYASRSDAAKLLEFTAACFDVVRGLRGQSLPATIQYPRGDRLGLTTYDLGSTLRSYGIDHVTEDNTIVLTPTPPEYGVVTARLPGINNEPTRYDKPRSQIEEDLQTKLHQLTERVASSPTCSLDTSLFNRFYQIITITDALVPERLTTADYEFTVTNPDNAPTELEITHRNNA